MISKQKDYQRTHLRAPYYEPVLYVDNNFVFKASTLNLSEGGILLDQVPHFPEESEIVPLMISFKQYPYFKNFSLERLESYSDDVFPKIIVRVKSQMVRKIGIQSKTDEVFQSRIGLKFTEVSQSAAIAIKDYVSVFSSNLIYLQVLIDSLNTNEANLKKIRILSEILGYDAEMKIALLHKKVQHDYKSLQWL
jgi:hypothetical protein